MVDMAHDLIQLKESDDVKSYGYWVDVEKSIQFTEHPTQTWIQAMPLGTFQHPVHGPIVISPERVAKFADNVNNKVRGQDLDIDYDHKELTTEAAGWVKAARADVSNPDESTNGLWLLVDWTVEAAAKIKSKAFRYFSPEFVDVWKHPVTGQVFKDVLFGGGLTNRPFLKGILPINLSEMTDSQTTTGDSTSSDGGKMDREFLELMARSLNIEFEESTSDADLKALLDAYEAPEANSDDIDDSDDTVDEDSEEPTADMVSASELKKLAEANPLVAKLLAEQAEDRKRLAVVETANKLAEVNVKLSELKTTKRTLTPVAQKKLSDIMVSAPQKLSDNVFTLVREILDGATVELGERGGAHNGGEADIDAGGAFEAEVTKLTEGENGMNYADAVEQVAADNPALFEEYRNASFAGKD